jgi:NADH-ubiquinone oxidoreductase chain 2
MLLIALCLLMSAVALPSINLNSIHILRFTSLCFVGAFVMAANTVSYNDMANGVLLFNGLVDITYSGLLMQSFLCLMSVLALVPWSSYRLSKLNQTAYPSINSYNLFALLSVMGGSMLMVANDLTTLYMSLELQSFSVYIMAAIYRTNKNASDSAIMYFMLGALSSCIMLLGMAFVYNEYGTTALEPLGLLYSNNTSLMGVIGVVAIGVGAFFKVTAAPFHNWGAFVYSKAPTIVTIWIANMPKIALLVVLLKLSSTWCSNGIVLNDISNINVNAWNYMLLFSAVLSMLFGTIVGLVQAPIKRLLAYSTVSHIGFMLLALAITTNDSYGAYSLYAFQYIYTSVLSFSILLAMGYVLNMHVSGSTFDLNLISELKGSYGKIGALSFCMAITLLSMAGVPPLIGFYAKQAVLASAMKSGYIFMSILGIVTSVISAGYYLHLIRVMNFDNSTSSNVLMVEGNDKVVNGQSSYAITSLHSYVISSLTLGLFVYTIFPAPLIDTCRLMALTLFNT